MKTRRTRREYRRTCSDCGMDEVVARRPKDTPWHWPRTGYMVKQCSGTIEWFVREVTRWVPAAGTETAREEHE